MDEEYEIVLNGKGEEIPRLNLSEINPPNSEVVFRILWVGFVSQIKAFSVLIRRVESSAITEKILLNCVNDFEGKITPGIGIKFVNSLAVFLHANGHENLERGSTIKPQELADDFQKFKEENEREIGITFMHEKWDNNDGSTREIFVGFLD